jgi:hypothetical protein
MKTEISVDMDSREARIVENLQYWMREAEALGLIVTADRVALMPPAMGHAETVMHVRREIDHAGEAAVRGGYQLEGSTCD